MRSRPHIIGTLFVCAVGFPVLAQETSTSNSSAAAYREHLKAISSDINSGSSPTDATARERYKQNLRSLAGDDLNDNSANDNTITTPTVSSESNSTLPYNSGSEPQRSTTVPLRQNVALPAQTSSSAGDQPSATNSSAGCVDAYCAQLRRIADGDLQTRNARLESGRTLTTERNFIRNLAFDQMHIWTSPFRMRDSDATWAIPFGIVAGSLFATDRDVSKQLAKPNRQDISKKISDAGLFGSLGVGAGFYGLGLISRDEHKRETGLLAGEAFINATLVAQALKISFGRQRPFEGDGFGHIGRGGSSFPSEHAIGTWAIASVVAHEYPNALIQIGAYGLAATVAATRVTAGQHFPSDVLVGSAFGYLIGRQVYKAHHNPELGGSEYGTFVRERTGDAEHSGSPYVPLESWVYPVIDRLAALGLVHSNFDSERPFTRLECARLAQEAVENAAGNDLPADQQAMIDTLRQEFSRETEVWAGDSANRSFQLESVYSRVTEIAGPVLRDGYHFGQTLYNDYGRPYGRGFNNVTGFSARATSGPLVFYFRGEYQHAPASPGYTPEQQTLMSARDLTPEVINPFPAQSRFQVLDAYMGINFLGNQLTLGQQSLWWGPGTAGPFLFSNNAAPLKMVRLNNISPVEIPLLSKLVGPMRYEMFLGQTDGYNFILSQRGLNGPSLGTQPFIQGQRFSFKPTPNLEFGFSRTALFGGTGYPLTSRYFFLDTFSLGNTGQGAPNKPGDRRSGFDLTYRIPPFRDWLSFYIDEFSEDEITPVFIPRRSAMHPGIYMARLPKLPKLDLRVEGVYTDIPSFAPAGYFYWNLTFLSGYRKDGNILGNWIGREARGVYATSTLWLSGKNTIQLGYREATMDREFLKGGRYQDEFIKAGYAFKPDLALSAMVQYENWHFPLLRPGLQTNVSSSVQITYTPKWRH